MNSSPADCLKRKESFETENQTKKQTKQKRGEHFERTTWTTGDATSSGRGKKIPADKDDKGLAKPLHIHQNEFSMGESRRPKNTRRWIGIVRRPFFLNWRRVDKDCFALLLGYRDEEKNHKPKAQPWLSKGLVPKGVGVASFGSFTDPLETLRGAFGYF